MSGFARIVFQSSIVIAFVPALDEGHTQTFNCDIPVPTLKDQMIGESITRYPGNCPCPYNRDARGRRCGKRSAWDRQNGYSPLCFPADITPDMVRDFCEVLKMRRQG